MISTNDNYAKLQNLFDLHCRLYDFLLKKEDSKEKKYEELSSNGPFLINDSAHMHDPALSADCGETRAGKCAMLWLKPQLSIQHICRVN